MDHSDRNWRSNFSSWCDVNLKFDADKINAIYWACLVSSLAARRAVQLSWSTGCRFEPRRWRGRVKLSWTKGRRSGWRNCDLLWKKNGRMVNNNMPQISSEKWCPMRAKPDSTSINFCLFFFQGNYFLFIEMSNQLHRTLVPIPVWLFYLLENSDRLPSKVLGVFLVAAYMVFKGKSILKTALAWKLAASKLLESTVISLLRFLPSRSMSSKNVILLFSF
jgi:hypothetical protein